MLPRRGWAGRGLERDGGHSGRAYGVRRLHACLLTAVAFMRQQASAGVVSLMPCPSQPALLVSLNHTPATVQCLNRTTPKPAASMHATQHRFSVALPHKLFPFMFTIQRASRVGYAGCFERRKAGVRAASQEVMVEQAGGASRVGQSNGENCRKGMQSQRVGEGRYVREKVRTSVELGKKE